MRPKSPGTMREDKSAGLVRLYPGLAGRPVRADS